MSVTVILELKAVSGGIERLLTYLEEVLPETRRYSGYGGLRVLRDTNDPTLIVCIEKWESATAYQKYLEWRMQTGVMARLASMLEGIPRPIVLSELTP